MYGKLYRPGLVAPNLPEAEAIHVELGRGQATAGVGVRLDHSHSAPKPCTDWLNCRKRLPQPILYSRTPAVRPPPTPVLAHAEAVRQRLTGFQAPSGILKGLRTMLPATPLARAKAVR